MRKYAGVCYSFRACFACRPSSEVEHLHGKEGVTSSILVGGSIAQKNSTATIVDMADRRLLGRIADGEMTPLDRRYMNARTALGNNLYTLSKDTSKLDDREPTEQLVVALENLNMAIGDVRTKLGEAV